MKNGTQGNVTHDKASTHCGGAYSSLEYLTTNTIPVNEARATLSVP